VFTKIYIAALHSPFGISLLERLSKSPGRLAIYTSADSWCNYDDIVLKHAYIQSNTESNRTVSVGVIKSRSFAVPCV